MLPQGYTSSLTHLQELSAVSGVLVDGPVPGDLDVRFRFSAAVVNGTPHGNAEGALIGYLLTPQATAVTNAKGTQASVFAR